MSPKHARATKSSSIRQPSNPKVSYLSGPSDVAKQKSFKPLLSVSKPPIFDLSSCAPEKGKTKSKEVPKLKSKPETISLLDDDDFGQATSSELDDRLWVDAYEPQTEAELAVHKRKVEDVRRWFQEAFEGGPTGKLKKYRRILVLTGPAGTAKTATVRILSKELGFDVLEWRNALEEIYVEDDYDYEGLNQKFETFLARAAACRPLLGIGSIEHLSSSSSSSLHNASQKAKPTVILLEDLPNVLHQPTQASFHSALESFVSNGQGTPLVIIVSDASTRGEVRDERLAQGGTGGSWSSRDTVDVRTILPLSLLNGPFVTEIAFNPIAPTLMLRALQELLTRLHSGTKPKQPVSRRPTKEELNIIVEASNGDIRSAVMVLQFSCVLGSSSSRGGKSGKGKKKGSRVLWAPLISRVECFHLTQQFLRSMEAVTRREQALALFHLMGKVLYNKRKGDPFSTSASAKDKLHEQELDARLVGSQPLPAWLADHERRPSRVDVDNIYADSPIETGLFALYIHQNYPQFCDDVDQCVDLSDWLSWVDCSGGEHWYQTNPHQFHLLTLGTLHSLPSPVSRRGQKIYKPEFFDVLKRTREADDALSDARVWLQGQSLHQGRRLEEGSGARWSREEIAREMGAVLKIRSRCGISQGVDSDMPPVTHSAFSTLVFSLSNGTKASVLDAATDDAPEEFDIQDEDALRQRPEGEGRKAKEDGVESWLSDDDIDEF